MKYRTKLTLAFISLAFLSTALGLLLLNISSKRLLFDETRSNVLTLATTAAAELDGDLFKDLATPSAENTPRYHKAIQILRAIRDANRRSDFFAAYIYTIQPDPQKPGEMIFGVDADEQQPAKPGDPVIAEDMVDIVGNLDQPYVDRQISRDSWGLRLSAFAPIKDSQGKYVATLGVDISEAEVHTETRQLWLFGLLSLGASVILATLLAMTLSHFVTKSLASLCSAVKEIGEGHLESKVHLDTHDEFNDLAIAINQMSSGLEERERLKANFAKYVSAQVLEKILTLESFQQLEGESRKITVLFSDIRDFTRLTEKMPPEQVVLFLNEYFDKMIDIIFKYYGTLDKFIGDGLMVEFGAPLEDPRQAEHALSAATEMLYEVEKLNEKWKNEGKPSIRVGIGINTGFAVVGNIGSIKRVEYTAIGDTVNVAARLEEATKLLQQTILLGEATYIALKDLFPCRSLGEVTLPGRVAPLRVYTVDIDELRRKAKI